MPVTDLTSLWRDAAADTLVCSATGAAKYMVLAAITEGACDFDSVAKRVKLCGTADCARKNPSCADCRANVEALLEVYLPIHQLMTAGGGCHHDKPKQKGCAEAGCSCGSECGSCSTGCAASEETRGQAE